jgi:penicillin amidase
VPSRRLLRYINLLIALLLAAVLGTGYWFVYRVLPQTGGRVAAPIQSAATVTRDSAGVPHIRAASIEDALFLQGYVTAQDRLWQLDALRRFASGDLAEVVGPRALPVDIETRKLRVRRVGEANAQTLRPEERRFMEAYARGITHFIETHRTALPLEFTLLGYQPKPWTVVDTIAVGLHMFRDMTSSWKDEVLKAAIVNAKNYGLAMQLFPVRTGHEFHPALIELRSETAPVPARADFPFPGGRDEAVVGSNAWVMGGRRTASGKPILANDPHLEFGIPSTWYMVHLTAPGLNVSGVSLPGVPSVIIGHNDRIAWGVTNLHFDVQDLYIERIDLKTGRYVFKGKTEQALDERGQVRVRGQKPVEVRNWVTRHGPIWATSAQRSLALRWVATEEGNFEFPFVEINRAKGWNEFLAALRRFHGPAQNFIYADVEGNIGYKAAGFLPVRTRHFGDFPVDGSSGAFEWGGYIPFDELPSAFNPVSGLIVTANQNPFPADYKYRVHGSFAPHYRAQQIYSLLSSRTDWKPDEMLAVQKDVYSAAAKFLAQEAVTAYDRNSTKNSDLAEAVEVLRNWNGQMEKGTAAPVISTLIYQHLRLDIAERAAPRQGVAYESSMAPAVVERLLRSRPKEWFPDFDAVLLKAFRGGVEEGKRLFGRNIKGWDYGVSIQLHLQHPVGSRIPVIGPYFNIGPYPMSGSGTTVKQTTRRVGPSMRFVADLSDWSKSLNNITLGQSGQFLSSHYKDQWDEYYAGRSLPMRWGEVEGDTLRLEPSR